MTPAEMAVVAFTTCNSVRVIAYAPQILKVARDQDGAQAVSCATWAMFALSHLSTVLYALLAVADWKMASVFVANTVCCVLILGLTLFKRTRRNADRTDLGGPDTTSLRRYSGQLSGCASRVGNFVSTHSTLGPLMKRSVADRRAPVSGHQSHLAVRLPVPPAIVEKAAGEIA